MSALPGAAHAAGGYPLIGLVSVPEGASPTTGDSLGLGRAVSGTGRYVVYDTVGRHTGADDNFLLDVYVRDLLLQTTELVSSDATGDAVGGSDGSVSSDGCRIAFLSSASLITPASNGAQIYVIDRCVSPRAVWRASVYSETNTPAPFGAPANDIFAISGDGMHVLFAAKTDLSGGAADCASGAASNKGCLFVHDLLSGKTVRMDVATDGTPADGPLAFFGRPDISSNGRRIVFGSEATNLITDDTNGEDDAFLRDRDTDNDGVLDETGAVSTVRISVTAGGSEVTDHGSIGDTAISGNGAIIAFESFSETLVPADPNPGGVDVFVRDLDAETLERFGRVPAGEFSCCGNRVMGISDDGGLVAFSAIANVGDAGGAIWVENVYVRDRELGVSVTVIDAGTDPDLAAGGGGISGDGSLVTFSTGAQLASGDSNAVTDVYAAGSIGDPVVPNDLLVDFGGAGLWQRLNDSAWQKIHNASPLSVGSGDLDGSGKDEAIVGFSGAGLWARYDNATWTKLHPATPKRFVTGDVDGSGADDLVVDFGGAGLWVRYNNTTWAKRHNGTSQDMAVGDLDGNGNDDLIVDFGGAGLWVRCNNATWVKRHNRSPTRMTTGDLDGNGKAELIAAFGAAGLWVRYNNATWAKLHNGAPQLLATGDLDGNGRDELLADFGGAGLWVRYNNATWVKRHAASPIHMVAADLDSSGKAELIADFGGAGLWARYNNATWMRLHNASTQGFAPGGLD